MVYHGSKSVGLVNMHVQDLAENSTDFAHFSVLHSELAMPVVKHFLKVPWPHGAQFPDSHLKAKFYNLGIFITFSTISPCELLLFSLGFWPGERLSTS